MDRGGAVLPPLTLVLGPVRSGKSAFAERLCAAAGVGTYLATAVASDGEMADRIAAHRARRPAGWRTVELGGAGAAPLPRLPPAGPVLLDGLGLWLAPRLPAAPGPAGETEALAALDRLLASARPSARRPLVVVSEEVGWGVVPTSPAGRRFRDLLGLCNQRCAAAADQVVLVVAGCPLWLRGAPPPEASR